MTDAQKGLNDTEAHRLTRSVRLSVLVAVYNVEAWLGACLDSLAAQTASDVEFIVVDDGSTDRSGAICEAYARTDARFRVIHKAQNEGLLLCRKTAMTQARGDWVLFVDGDDCLASPTALATLIELVQRSRADILQFDVRLLGATPEFEAFFRTHLRQRSGRQTYVGGERIVGACFCERAFGWNVWNKLYRRELVQRACTHAPDVHFTLTEDVYWFFVFGFFANTMEIQETEPLYCYRVGSGVSTSALSLQKFDAISRQILLIEWLERFLKEHRAQKLYRPHVKAIRALIVGWARSAYFGLPPAERAEAVARLARYYDKAEVKRLVMPEGEPKKSLPSRLWRWIRRKAAFSRGR